jgi:pyruvate,orthophosphate dikinase
MAPAKTRAVFFFGGGKAEGRATDRNLLGGKGANLAEMTRIGLPVPAGFTISTDVCAEFYRNGRRLPKSVKDEIRQAVRRVERVMGARFGDPSNPLLVSVRSGARVSMPGMMDTVLNLGLNDATVRGLAERSGDPRFAWDSFRRFVQMYGDVVLGLKPESQDEIDPFERILHEKKRARGVASDQQLSAEDLQELVAKFQDVIRKRTPTVFPDDPWKQLESAIGAVFGSWMNPRAVAYRRLNGIPAAWGTAVNVQAMVFGNLGEECATGVAFTRNPATGENHFYGEYLVNAQGEDVVAGVRTPEPIEHLRKEWPKVYRELDGIQRKLEKHYHDMQDLEFTIQNRKLWMLQTRSGKRTGKAAVRIAVEMVDEGLISREEALRRVQPAQIEQFLSPGFDPVAKEAAVRGGKVVAKGLPAGPGAASGRIVLTADDAVEWSRRGETVILVRHETSAEDIHGMAVAAGFLTSRGGMTSHAALVARQMGKVCVVGCHDLEVDYAKRRLLVGERAFKEGDWISIHGTTGEVIQGHLETQPSEVIRVLQGHSKARGKRSEYGVFSRILRWADEVRRLDVRANADQPDQASMAMAFGAAGIGLCRTEHMFFGEDRIAIVQRMILSENEEQRREALAELLPLQRADFAGLFRAMRGNPVTIRTLDPPLHEFLPKDPKDLAALAKALGIPRKKLDARIESLRESNPMLGHRGCRLGILHPEITEMQARAILEAACDVRKKGKRARPEIMIPLVGHSNELRLQREVVDRVAKEVFKERKTRVPYLVGTMIELPRAAIRANAIAEHADFFSFGTNDLTQTTFGLSRDDSGSFLPFYLDHGILEREPFTTLDVDGVGELMRIGVEKGKGAKADLHTGICGEHGGDPATIHFCHGLGLDYVSCSPYRIPVARLAAAQAVLEERDRNGKGPGRGKKKSARRPRAARAR